MMSSATSATVKEIEGDDALGVLVEDNHAHLSLVAALEGWVNNNDLDWSTQIADVLQRILLKKLRDEKKRMLFGLDFDKLWHIALRSKSNPTLCRTKFLLPDEL